MRDHTELYRLLVASVRDYAIFVLDPRGNVATWNAGAQRIKGYDADEIIGTHFSRFYPLAEITSGKCEYELEVAAREGRFEDEGWRLRKDGTRFWANVVISALRDAEGGLVGFAKVTRDLTERRRNEDDRTARLVAEQANRTKDEFLAMLGHELRNPLAPIVTALQLIRMRGDSPSSKEHDIIERQVSHMIRLVDDLLDIARITRGKVDLKMKRIDLRGVISKSIEIVGPLFEQRRHHLEIASPSLPVVVEGDESRLTQVVTNLLTNAARYTEPEGRVDLRLAIEGDDAVLEVQDNGTGIDAELLPRVFDLFVQGYQSSERTVGGLGLGLTLVRSLVTLHGGTVEASSPGVDQGSTFVVRIPAVPASASGAETSTSGRWPRAEHGKRVLLVDDNEDACFLLAEILVASGHDVRTAGDGPEALQQVADFAPDVAVLDIGLPVMDGYELAGKLCEVLPARPRLIALSGYGAPSDQARSKAAGFDQHLVKPVDVRRLLESIGAA